MVMSAVWLSVRIGRVDRMDTEQTFNAADDAANRAADDRANRSSCVHANGTAVGDLSGMPCALAASGNASVAAAMAAPRMYDFIAEPFLLLESREVAANQGVGVAMELRNAAMRRSAARLRESAAKRPHSARQGRALEHPRADPFPIGPSAHAAADASYFAIAFSYG